MSVAEPTEREDAARAEAPEASDLEKKLSDWAKIGVPAATVTGAVITGAVLGAAPAILVLAGGALVGGIAAFWASVRTLAGETPLSGADAYAIGTPRVEEEQKRAVLRALKDLEFERSVGKISDEDYQALVTKYRAEAKRLLRLLDEDAAPRRQQVEGLVTKRLRQEGLLATGYREPLGDVAPAAKPKGKRRGKASAPNASSAPATNACASCATTNDADARFCKKCGARLDVADTAGAAGTNEEAADEAPRAAGKDDEEVAS